MPIDCSTRWTDRSNVQFAENANKKFYKKGNKRHFDAACSLGGGCYWRGNTFFDFVCLVNIVIHDKDILGHNIVRRLSLLLL